MCTFYKAPRIILSLWWSNFFRCRNFANFYFFHCGYVKLRIEWMILKGHCSHQITMNSFHGLSLRPFQSKGLILEGRQPHLFNATHIVWQESVTHKRISTIPPNLPMYGWHYHHIMQPYLVAVKLYATHTSGFHLWSRLWFSVLDFLYYWRIYRIVTMLTAHERWSLWKYRFTVDYNCIHTLQRKLLTQVFTDTLEPIAG